VFETAEELQRFFVDYARRRGLSGTEPPPPNGGIDNSLIDRSVAIRTALCQAALVAVLSIALAIALPRSFFEDWGWLAGPGAWMLCALITASLLALPRRRALLGAALAGLPSLIAVVIGVHWLGAVIAIALFAIWCGRLPARDATVSSA
jgi:hypothetical protein